MGRLNRTVLWSVTSIAGFLIFWQLASGTLIERDFLPAPTDVLAAGVDMTLDGTLAASIGASLQRIFTGWAIGSLVAVPIGLVAGATRVGRAILDPFIHFFRFVPAIALISLFIIWFGVGEMSKIALIGYATAFTVTVNTAVGAASIQPDKLSAARCLGATPWRVFRDVTVPASIPAMFTGMRLAMAQSFLVIVAVEALAANAGLGFIIWNSRLYFRTDWAMVGIVCLGLIGYFSDRLWKTFGRTLISRFTGAAASY
jgi:NitT/TauT family transport system permease protein